MKKDLKIITTLTLVLLLALGTNFGIFALPTPPTVYLSVGNDSNGIFYYFADEDSIFVDLSGSLSEKHEGNSISSPNFEADLSTGAWSIIGGSDIVVDYIYVKSGNDGNTPAEIPYLTTKQATSSFGNLYEFLSNLTSGTVSSPTGGISHITFYYHIETPTTTTTTTTTATTTTTTNPVTTTTTTTIPDTTTTTTTIPDTTTTTTTIPDTTTTTTTIPDTTTTTTVPVTTTTTTTIPETTTTTTVPDESTTTTTTTTTTRRTTEERTTTTIPDTTTTEEETTTVTIPETTPPLAVPTVTIPLPITPLALPKTGEIPFAIFYGLGGMFVAAGLYMKRR